VTQKEREKEGLMTNKGMHQFPDLSDILQILED